MGFQTGDWIWSDSQQQAGQVLDQQTVWGEAVYRLWFPEQEQVRRVPASQLRPIASAQPFGEHAIRYRAVAARIADALAQDLLIAPIDSPVIPLPHQIRALSRVTTYRRET